MKRYYGGKLIDTKRRADVEREIRLFRMEMRPSVQTPISFGSDAEGDWWVKFSIDIHHDLAWHAVQELSCVINYLSINERLPSKFYPVSPAPYLNGGPTDYLSWVIENDDKDFKPDTLTKWLEGRLPQPVDDLTQWIEE
ncbi:hypothetical protein OQZ33_00430 [Pedobacter sp. MC2016-05]|uniref:hypothetical protein n=1 Tax=Pedobacter sp. MC2016-05 TaxID=2994474 RepID=UPI00224578CE|nr:hypothetical protein [Pedobacter sp. MC2016-05]MCX2472784.1 hypothetical protein [Pedobacter sp. MC2016-05]